MIRLLALPVLLLSLMAGAPAFSADYQKGLDAAKKGDTATALREWTPLAEQGHVLAQHNLGVTYRHGMGVPQDYKVAIKWFTLAAEQGDAEAQYNLGVTHAQGRGTLQNYTRAHMWANLAASSGFDDGAKLRNIVAKLMTSADVSTAQRLARESVEKNYKGC